jgi:hypothetical protein
MKPVLLPEWLDRQTGKHFCADDPFFQKNEQENSISQISIDRVPLRQQKRE